MNGDLLNSIDNLRPQKACNNFILTAQTPSKLMKKFPLNFVANICKVKVKDVTLLTHKQVWKILTLNSDLKTDAKIICKLTA